MSTLLPYIVNWLQLYGYPVIWLCVFTSSVGAPLPTALVLLATGAFAALGDFNVAVLIALTVTASVSGDNTGYLIGRWIGKRLFAWLEHQKRFRFISPERLARAHTYFEQRGGWAIFLSRFLISFLGGTINLLAGAEKYPYWRFLIFDFTGQVLGAAIPLLLGFAFGASWEIVGSIMGAVSVLALALIVVIFLALYIVKTLQHTRATSPQMTEKMKTIVAGHSPETSKQQVMLNQKESSTDSLPL